MAGYWSSSSRDKVKVHKIIKKEQGRYPAILTKQAWSIKDLLYGQKNFAFAVTKRAIPSEQDRAHLAHSGGQSEHRIRFILPAYIASHIIKCHCELLNFSSACAFKQLFFTKVRISLRICKANLTCTSNTVEPQFNPFTPRSDQYINSPYNFNTLSRR